jgi:hypothetical protein
MAVFDGAAAGGGVGLAGLAVVRLAEGFAEGAEARWVLVIELREEGGMHMLGLVSPMLACAKPTTKVWLPGMALGLTDAGVPVSQSLKKRQGNK